MKEEKNKKYYSVSEMIHDLSDDSQFNDEFDKLITKKVLIKYSYQNWLYRIFNIFNIFSRKKV